MNVKTVVSNSALTQFYTLKLKHPGKVKKSLANMNSLSDRRDGGVDTIQ